MRQLRFILTIILGVLVTAAGAASAKDVALVLGDRGSPFLKEDRDQYWGARIASILKVKGFQVIEASSRDAGNLLGSLIELDRMVTNGEVDRLVVLVTGPFAHTDSNTWALSQEANTNEQIPLALVGVPVSYLSQIAARANGAAAMMLGFGYRKVDLAQGLTQGIGPFFKDEGAVTYFEGPVEDLYSVLADGLLNRDKPLALVSQQSPETVRVSGYLTGEASFLGPLPVRARPREQGYWQAVQDINTVKAYRTYLETFAQGVYVEEAIAKIQDIELAPVIRARELEDQLKLTRTNKRDIQADLKLLGHDPKGIDGVFGAGSRAAITAWQKENRFPETGYVTEVQLARLAEQAAEEEARLAEEERLRRIAERRADELRWRRALDRGGEADFQGYLSDFPNGAYASEAKNRLREIEAQRRSEQERAAWRIAQQVDGIRAYRQFLERFPDGRFANDAKKRLDELTLIRREEAEMIAWQDARADNSVRGYVQFIEKYPDSRFTAEAQSRLRDLRREQREAAELAAWDQARRTNTLRAYSRFQEDYPDSRFAAEARERMRQLAGQPGEDSNRTASDRAQESRAIKNTFTRLLVEERLRDLGMNPGNVNGQFDENTRAAIRRFQQSIGQPATGYIGNATMARLLAGR